MADTLISTKLPPDIDPTKAPLAFGERAVPKLNEQLGDTDLKTRQRALMALCDILHDPENIHKAIRNVVIGTLVGLLKDEDEVVRVKSTQAFYIMSGHATGRQVMSAEEVIKPLAAKFDDEVYLVRLNAHQTIERLSSVVPGPDTLVECGLIPLLVQKLPTEHDEIKLVILTSLSNSMRMDFTGTLETDACNVLTNLLDHENTNIRAQACLCIKELSLPTEGKNKACDSGCVEKLCSLVSLDEQQNVQSSGCAALMVIAIITRGKRMILQCDVIAHLINILKQANTSTELRLNSLKLITCLAEAPQGRMELSASVKTVERLRHDDISTAVRKAAEIAVKTIKWKP